MGTAILVTMPWLNPDVASLALATLQPILQQAGIPTDVLYGSLLFPHTDTPFVFVEQHGGMMFTPYLYPNANVDELIEHAIEQRIEVASKSGVLSDNPEAFAATLGFRRDRLRASIRRDIDRAGVCLARCLPRALGRAVVGFSIMFETQLTASLALAQRLKQRDPSVRIAFGGAACAGEQAEGILRSFDAVDVVCHGEGESSVVPLFKALLAGGDLDAVPGIAFRRGDEIRITSAAPLLERLDDLPMPRYDDYFAQLSVSEWRAERPVLPFETSRGCWWGQKHLCTFCGLNAEGLTFRRKSPERAYAEIEDLYGRYPLARGLQAADNILDHKYYTTVLPQLARMPRDPKRPLTLFYEVKSNLRASQVGLLAAAGVTHIQAGIEALDDELLALMDKGCTALMQVQFIKWAYQEGLVAMYNILVRSPGESLDSYQRMSDRLPFITHLPPPGGLTPVMLMRFSPYFERPADFGIQSRTPFAYYRQMYPDPRVDLDRIAYRFEYDHPMLHDEAHRAAIREFCFRVRSEWQEKWKPHRAFYVDHDDHIVVHDRRGATEITERLAGVEAEVFRAVDSARPYAALAKRFGHRVDLAALLAHWYERRWVCRSREDDYLSVLPLERLRPRDIETVVSKANLETPIPATNLVTLSPRP